MENLLIFLQIVGLITVAAVVLGIILHLLIDGAHKDENEIQ